MDASQIQERQTKYLRVQWKKTGFRPTSRIPRTENDDESVPQQHFHFVELVICILVLVISILAFSISGSHCHDAQFSDYDIQSLISKLEYVQAKLETMESAMKEIDRELLNAINQQTRCKEDRAPSDMNLLVQSIAQSNEQRSSDLKQLARSIEQIVERMDSKINQQNDTVTKQQTQTKEDREINNQKSATATGAVNHPEQIMNHNVTSQSHLVKSVTNKPQTSVGISMFQSCNYEPTKRSGQYYLLPPGYEIPFQGYCVQDVFQGGWIVFQFRFDGSVNFFRNWTDYTAGFGSVNGEFWLGLEHLHRLTSARRHELLVELKDFSGSYKYARYDHFEISSESEKYALKTLGNHSGTAYDALKYHKGMKFTTYDKDNDLWIYGNCAATWKGAWWHKDCFASNLNGLYRNSSNDKVMDWKQSFPHSFTRMSIREI